MAQIKPFIRHLRLLAPAKINLGLRIVGRESSGFHCLETVFHRIALADILYLEIQPPQKNWHKSPSSGHTTIICENTETPLDERNSAHRALNLLRQLGAPIGDVRLRIDKRIPIGGGLGGSSADAAAILAGLRHLLPAQVSRADLAQGALGLGADVPFLMGEQACAHGHGRGERLTSMRPWSGRPLWLIIPPWSCPTPQVFAALNDAERAPRSLLGCSFWQRLMDEITLNLRRPTPAKTHGLLHNDLLSAALRVSPALNILTDWARAQGLPWALSGSGSCCYLLEAPSKPPPLGCRVMPTHFA